MEDDDVLMRGAVAPAEKTALPHAKKDNNVYAFNPFTHGKIQAAMKNLGMTP